MEAVLIIGQILLLNLVLSADNALVIAMASRHLPARQKKWAIWAGTALALLLRVGFLFLAVQLLKWPAVEVVGALLLLWIAWQLATDKRDGDVHISQTISLRMAIWLILSADLVMSLDNVLAIAAVAEQQTAFMLAGVALSIPLMIGGSHLFIRLIERYPWLNKLGALILIYTSCEMLFSALM